MVSCRAQVWRPVPQIRRRWHRSPDLCRDASHVMPREALLQSQVPSYPCRRGKVRDVYDLGDTLAIVATDRISAFDHVMPNGIPVKGRILTELSVFWFGWLNVPHHLLGTDLKQLPAAFQRSELEGRTM